MKLRIASDFHTEFYTFDEFRFQEMEDEKKQILVLAGDVGTYNSLLTKTKYFNTLLELSKRFKTVLIIPGNHEYYGSNLKKFHSMNIKDKRKLLFSNIPKNVIFLDNETKVIGNFCFIGTTLWTDYNRNNPTDMYSCKNGLNDHRKISWDDKPVSPEVLYELHKESIRFILKAYEMNSDKRKIIITHHMPSMQCVNKCYTGSSINHGFASDLDGLIKTLQPELWISGHTHSSYDFLIGKTRLICNPTGYPHNYGDGFENNEFNPKLIVEI